MTQTPISEKTNLAAGARFLKLWGVIPGLADNLIHQLVLLLFLITKLMEAFHGLENMSFLHFCHFLIVQVWQNTLGKATRSKHALNCHQCVINKCFLFFLHSLSHFHLHTFTLTLSHFNNFTILHFPTFTITKAPWTKYAFNCRLCLQHWQMFALNIKVRQFLSIWKILVRPE